MSDITERLLDSEEYATDEAIPEVAEAAAEEIHTLRDQRDDLLAALKKVEASAGNSDRVYEIACSAITKAEGEK